MPKEIDELMTIAKAAALTGHADSTLCRHVYRGELSSAKISTCLLLPKSGQPMTTTSIAKTAVAQKGVKSFCLGLSTG
jgi:hypothetical protein